MTDAPEISPTDIAQWLNAQVTGWNATMGLRFVHATGDEVVARLDLAEHHRQPHGIVHGGVHAGIIEATCSTGAAIWGLPKGLSVVGLENSTSFLRAVREGSLTVTAVPLSRGRRSQVWEASVTSDDGKLAAQGRVRLLCLEAGTVLAGEALPDPKVLTAQSPPSGQGKR